MHRIILVSLIFFVCIPDCLAADAVPDRNDDRYIQEIDTLWHEAYGQIYSEGIDTQVLCMMKSMLDLCTRATTEDPDNYEYLWRYARAASQYASTAQSIHDGVPWKDICLKWGMRGYKMADRACSARPDRPEAFFWRNYCMGMYVLVGGIEPFIHAVREGFLPKSRENIIKGYAADKSYLEYVPVFARSQFPAHVPSIPFLVKGSKKDRYKEAMHFHEEHMACAGHLIREKTAFEWDMRAFFIAEFLLSAIKVLNPDACTRLRYRNEAREWCEFGLQGPRPYYVRLCSDMLADNKNWQ